MTKLDVSVLCLLFRFVQNPDYEMIYAPTRKNLPMHQRIFGLLVGNLAAYIYEPRHVISNNVAF